MKLLFLGTGGANWGVEFESRPDFFRRESSAVINNELLIDPGKDVLEALDTFHVDRKGVKYILNTHPHEDHLCKETLKALQTCGAEFIPFKVGETKTFGRYTVTAYKGNHAAIPTTHFLVSDGEKELYYGLDGAWLMPDAFHTVIDRRVAAVVLDGTYGFDTFGGIFEHNNMGMIVEMSAVLKQYVGKVYISHLSSKYHPSHEVLVKQMSEYGVDVAYDGLETVL